MKRLIKKSIIRASFHRILWVAGASVLLLATGCKKYLQIPLPSDSISGSAAFETDNATAGVVGGIYSNIVYQTYLSGTNGIGFCSGLYTDELQNVPSSSANTNLAYYGNAVIGDITGGFWGNFYKQIYVTNLALENVRSSSQLRQKNQWIGELLFVRGLLYYYLTNIYGDVPLSLSSDYRVNSRLSRVIPKEVYNQIVIDLKEAQGLLPANYQDISGITTPDRARPNKDAVTALLARVYLYLGDWANAEAQATLLINNTASFKLVATDQVFLKASQECIWGLAPMNTGSDVNIVTDARIFLIAAGTLPNANSVTAVLSPSLIGSFEANDNRYTNWVRVSTAGIPATNYYYAYKYKNKGPATTPTEYKMVLRLAEQYLIRAEARARLNKLPEAISDLNAIRSRAGLPATTAVGQAGILAAILQERRVELFTEIGQRFFDLRRTGNLDAVMTAAAPPKGGSWAPYKQYWPIVLSETINNPNLVQTPGY